MSRDQRLEDNWALFYAIEKAIEYKLPIIIVFNLVENFLEASLRQYHFLFANLLNLKEKAKSLGIKFILLKGRPEINIPKIIKIFNAKCIITDFDPLKIKKEWKEKVLKAINIDFYEVDAHNIVPCWIASEKQEYAAYTIRPKIKKLLPEFLESYPDLNNYKKQLKKLNLTNNNNNNKYNKCNKYNKNNKDNKLSSGNNLNLDFIIDLNIDSFNESLTTKSNKFNKFISNKDIEIYLIKNLRISNKIKPTKYFKPGCKNGLDTLKEFIENKLKNYFEFRNDPSKDFQSNLSPYLHFGQISAQRVALEILKLKPDNKNNNYHLYNNNINAFLEELIIRKELSDNFCNYNLNYDNFESFPIWAQNTLNEHRFDNRKYIYNLDQLEMAETHDELWNAAQIEMVKTGKMHGYMRMYWAKKILEWTSHPEEALEYAILLNDRYELDGRDPNGYTGISWSIGGVHDRAWPTRPVFGKIRYMSYNNLKSKFNIKKYIEKVNKL